MDKNFFSYHLTKYFAEYLPKQTAASPNTIRSYRDTFVQLMEFYKTEYRLPPEKLEYKEFNAERIESFLVYLEEVRKVSISTRNQRLAAIHAFFRYLQYRDPAGFEQCEDILLLFNVRALGGENRWRAEDLLLEHRPGGKMQHPIFQQLPNGLLAGTKA